MNPNPFKRDDRVTLKTGGEPMLVKWVNGDQVYCSRAVKLGGAGYWEQVTFKASELVRYVQPE